MVTSALASPTTPLHAPQQLLNKQQLSKRIGVSVRTIENLVKAGEFPGGVRVGRFIYWTETAVAAWQRQLFAAQNSWQP